MHGALDEVKLHRVFLVHPGRARFSLHQKVEAVPLPEFLRYLGVTRQGDVPGHHTSPVTSLLSIDPFAGKACGRSSERLLDPPLRELGNPGFLEPLERSPLNLSPCVVSAEVPRERNVVEDR